MKRFFILFAALMAAVLVSCNKEESSVAGAPDEIVFSLCGEGLDFDVSTKADAVTSDNLSAVYWEATESGSVVEGLGVASYNVSSGKVSTGKYWPLVDATYSYMVSNVSFSSGKGVINATNDTDIVVGDATDVTKNTSCSVTLEHIFARTGTVGLTAATGFSVSEVSWTLVSQTSGPGTAGTYIIGSGWDEITTALKAQELKTGDDLYLMPGTYDISVTYTIKEDASSYVDTVTKNGTVTLVQGKVNNISAQVSGPGKTQIEFSVTVTDWADQDVTPSFNDTPAGDK